MPKSPSSWNRLELQAIGAYAQKHGYKLTMCSKPMAKFLDKDGKIIERPIIDLVSEWSQQKEEDRKHRAYEKRRLKQEEERASWGRRVI